ncbi:MAG TPA: leucine--tRNA ligase, partial [Parachlamydiales bacterium]|nr:leucine--tRNA ligase [Parachlamydiales bacterium]
ATTRKETEQWFFKITAYADQLLNNIPKLNWPKKITIAQQNWIGKTQGLNVSFRVDGSNEKIVIWTKFWETIFGTTFLVIAPEYPIIKSLQIPSSKKQSIENYIREASKKTEQQRKIEEKEKTGVFTGVYAINPASQEKVPVWIADYVLTDVGTGAVMGVPSHDLRDFEFAKKYGQPVTQVIEPTNGSGKKIDLKTEAYEEVNEGVMINSGRFNGLSVGKCINEITAWLAKRGVGRTAVNYKLRDWIFSRQRYWGEPIPILHFEDGSCRALDLSELPLTPPELSDYKPTQDGMSPLAKVREWVEIIDPKTGKRALRETHTMPQWAGSCWYYLRFCDPHNDEAAWDGAKERYWMPVDLYVGGVEHAVLHLLYARFWHKVLYDSDLVSTKEPFQTLRNQGLVTAHAYKREGGGYVAPDEVAIRDKKAYDKKTQEKLVTLVEKMSKSKLNGVAPDEMVAEHGADALRLYEMFMGPFEQEKLWNTDAMHGCHRFLSRVYDLVFSEKLVDQEDEVASKLAHRLVHSVERDVETLSFNTAIAKMMEFINAFQPLEKYPRSALCFLIQALYPFAPHLAEEAWEHLGGSESLTYHPFPSINPVYLEDLTVLYIVQINGKMRGKWELPKDKNEEELLCFIKKQPQIAKYLKKEIKKVIYVPNKLINLVVDG